MPRCVLLRFLGLVPLRVGVVMLTGVYTMLTFLLWMVNCRNLLRSFSTGEYALVGMAFLILVTWIVAFAGAFNSSRKAIRYALITWTVFISIWIGLTLHRVISSNKDFCVAKEMRCPPSMWLFELPDLNFVSSPDVSNEDDNIETEEEEEEKGGEEVEEKEVEEEETTTIEIPSTKGGPKRKNQMRKVEPTNFPKTERKSTTRLQRRYFKNEKIGGSRKKIRNNFNSEFVTSRSDRIDDDSFAEHATTKILTTTVRTTTTTMDKPQEAYTWTFAPTADGKNDSHVAEPIISPVLESEPTTAADNHLKFAITITFFLPLFLYSWLALMSYYIELKCMVECTCDSVV